MRTLLIILVAVSVVSCRVNREIERQSDVTLDNCEIVNSRDSLSSIVDASELIQCLMMVEHDSPHVEIYLPDGTEIKMNALRSKRTVTLTDSISKKQTGNRIIDIADASHTEIACVENISDEMNGETSPVTYLWLILSLIGVAIILIMLKFR